MTVQDIESHMVNLLNTLKISFLNLDKIEEAFIAGGAFVSLLNNEEVSDYDIWFRKLEDYESVVSNIPKANVTRKSRFATTIKVFFEGKWVKIQLVKNRLGEPDATVKTFDFLHTQSYFDFKNLRLFMDPVFLLTKKLVYVRGNHDHIMNTVQRMLKFVRRGYYIENQNLIELLKDVQLIANKKEVTNESFY